MPSDCFLDDNSDEAAPLGTNALQMVCAYTESYSNSAVRVSEAAVRGSGSFRSVEAQQPSGKSAAFVWPFHRLPGAAAACLSESRFQLWCSW